MDKNAFKKQVESLSVGQVFSLFFWYFFRPERVKKFEELLGHGYSAYAAFKNCKK